MTPRSMVLILLIVCAFPVMAQVECDLEVNSRYDLPIEGRFTTPSLSWGDTLLPLLNWHPLPVEMFTRADFQNNWVVFKEVTLRDKEIYGPRVEYIDNLLELYWKTMWGKEIMKEIVKESRKRSSIAFEIPFDFPKPLQRIFGEGGAGLHVTGYEKITISGRSQWTEGEVQTAYNRQSKFPSLTMKQDSRFSITGTVGSKVSVTIDQDSKRDMDLKNVINLKFGGEEDDIVHLFEAGNTTISLPNTKFAGYSEHVKGLFGLKGEFQLGPFTITAIASQEKGSKESAQFTAGASQREYTIRDYEYVKRKYFYLDKQFRYNTYQPGDSIAEVSLYVDDQIESNNLTMGAFEAWAVLEPNDIPIATESSESYNGYFHELSVNEYFVNRLEGWIRLETEIPQNYVLAAYYIVKHSDGTQDTVGGQWNELPVFNMIKPQNRTPEMESWEYEWRNVYYLGTRNIDPEGLEVNVFLGPPENGRDVDSTSGLRYIELFALDSTGEGYSTQPDGKVDPIRVDFGLGELFFPVPHPFAPRSEDIASHPSYSQLPSADQVPAIYNSTDETDIRSYSKFYIQAKTKSRAETFSLNKMNVIEGSETVYLNGTKLERGKDYQIDYTLGQITFLTDEALDPTSEVKVDFQYEPFFQASQRTLLGSRIQYNISDNSWIGTTGLFRMESSYDQKPRVGREPSRAFLWDTDMVWHKSLPFLTEGVNAIPRINTQAESKVKITGEAARLYSNPNTEGAVYLDDFEGSEDVFNLGVRRTAWTKSSAPYQRTQEQRGRLWWYNPYDRIPTRDIWPEREVSSNESSVNVLALTFKDTSSVGVNSWGGIIRSIPVGWYDQRKSRYLEVMVKGNEGTLVIDLGQISEDINGDGVLQSEDEMINGMRDGILQVDEDVGLDGLSDEEEREVYGSSASDPAGDNWDYDDHYDYSKINGTEANRFDPDGGKTPDTEDINHNGHLDTRNNYYQYKVDLSTNHFEVPGTRSPEDWRLLRIPIKDSLYTRVEGGRVFRREEVGSPNWERIEFARLWLTGELGEDDSTTVMIASIALVGNRWETNSQFLDVTVKSTQENTDYSPPPGVEDIRDPQTNLLLPEQSLVLKYDDLPPGSTVTAYRVLYKKEDYTEYKNLELYSNWVEGSPAPPTLVIRLASDLNNYYEYSVELERGWSTDNNNVKIDFEELTAFKNELLRAAAHESLAVDTVREAGNGWYYVKGTPSLTNINRWEIGIRNNSTQPISGEVWADELRLTNVKKPPGWAYRGDIALSFADLATFNSAYEEQNADFHGLMQSRGSGSQRRTRSHRVTFQTGKFFPVDWNVALPISYSYTRTTAIPKFITGTDIILPDSLREDEKSININQSFSSNLGLDMKDAPGWVDWTLNRMKHNYSWQRSWATSPRNPESKTTNYTITNIYDLTPKQEWKVSPLGFMGAEDFKLNLAPTNLKFNNQITSTKNFTRNQYDNITERETRDLIHRIDYQSKFIPPLAMNANLEIKRDIKESENIIVSPKRIKIGTPMEKRINVSYQYSPSFFGSFLTHRYGYSSSYTENTNPSRNVGYFASISRNQQFNANWTLKLTSLLGKGAAQGGFLHKDILSRIGDVQSSYTHQRQERRSGLMSRPGLAYQWGFSNSLSADIVPVRTVGTNNNQGLTIIDDINGQTNLKLPWKTDVSLSYQYRREHTKASSDRLLKSTVFPNMTVRWGGFSELPFIKKYTSSVSLSSAYNHRAESEYQEGKLTRRTSEHSLNPLFSLSITWKFGMRTEVNGDWSYKLNKNHRALNYVSYSLQKNSGLSVQNTYSFRAPSGFKIPLINTLVKFENNLNLSLRMSYENQERDEYMEGSTPIPVLHTIKWGVYPQASYDFSSNIRSGLTMELSDSKDVIRDRTTKVRGLNAWVEIRF